VSVRLLQRSELAAAAGTLVLAFDGDPLFRYFLPGPKERAKWLRWFMTRALGEALAVNGAFVLETGPETGIIGTYPPGRWPPRLGDLIGATPLPPGIPPWKLLVDGIPIEQQIHRLHPHAPHLYVYVLGVHPSVRGRGLGGVLLRHAAAIAKAAGVVSHLETSNPENLGLYRRFGFQVTNEIESHGGPPVWTMTTS
jgi:ribosomal protein S18 acetylase RimI-like enzyme